MAEDKDRRKDDRMDDAKPIFLCLWRGLKVSGISGTPNKLFDILVILKIIPILYCDLKKKP